MNMKKENPLTVQSKQWILEALLKLMEEKDYEKITIKELTARADLDRKTFYRNFRSKEEGLCDLYIQMLQDLPQLSAYSVTEAYLSLCRQDAHFFILLKRNNLLFLVLQKFDEYLPAINDLFLSNPVYRGKSKLELIYQAGGFWNITIHWINDGMEESPEEMAEVISRIIK
mgnify:CR=1 FL=1